MPIKLTYSNPVAQQANAPGTNTNSVPSPMTNDTSHSMEPTRRDLSASDTAQISRLIRQFGLLPHPEGGYYRETYRSQETVRRNATGNPYSASTAIYYLLADGAYSAWHRIAADEAWHFYAGHPLLVHVLLANGRHITHKLGNALQTNGATFQAVVPAGCWFAAQLAQPDSFAFVGCTVAPGFEFREFELATEQDLKPWQAQQGLPLRQLLKTDIEVIQKGARH